MAIIIHEVTKIMNTPPEYPPESYFIDVVWYSTNRPDPEDWYSETNYYLTQDDPYGLAPYLRQWMTDHPDFPITPYEEP